MTTQEQPEEITRDEANRMVSEDTGKWLPDGLSPQEQWIELVEILNNLITDYSFQHDDKELEPLKSFIKSQLEAARIDGELKMRERCILFGCHYGIEGVDKEPPDKCMFCDTPRNPNTHVYGQGLVSRLTNHN